MQKGRLIFLVSLIIDKNCKAQFSWDNPFAPFGEISILDPCFEIGQLVLTRTFDAIRVHNVSVTDQELSVDFEIAHPEGSTLNNSLFVIYNTFKRCSGATDSENFPLATPPILSQNEEHTVFANIKYPLVYAQYNCEFVLKLDSVLSHCGKVTEVPRYLQTLDLHIGVLCRDSTSGSVCLKSTTNRLPTTTEATGNTQPASRGLISSSTIVQAIIALIVLFILILCSITIYLFIHKKRKDIRACVYEEEFDDVEMPTIETQSSLEGVWQLTRTGVDVQLEIARGNFGVIKKGYPLSLQGVLNMRSLKQNQMAHNALLDLGFEKNQQIEVVVKQLPGDLLPRKATEKEQQEFIEEAELNVQLVCLLKYHESIIMFLGACTMAMPYQMVLAYCNQGSLVERLRNCRNYLRQSLVPDEPSMEDFNEATVLSVNDLMQLAIQICYGVHHMHKHSFIHRDLAARNILLHINRTQSNSRLTAKVTDFGLTRQLDEDGRYVFKDKANLPVFLEAIETRTQGLYSKASDCWGMGILLYEMVTYGLRPYKSTQYGDPVIELDELVEFLSSGKRLTIPAYCEDKLGEIILKCWAHDPSSRPTMMQLSQKLSSFVESLDAGRQEEHFDVYMGIRAIAIFEQSHASCQFLRSVNGPGSAAEENTNAYTPLLPSTSEYYPETKSM